MRDRRVTAAVLLGSMTWAGFPSAQSEEPIHLAYESLSPCPSQPAFEQAVRQRTRSWTAVAKDLAHRTFSVSLSNDGASWTGRLLIDRGGQVPSTRTVSGDSCEEVAEAMALVVAVAIDPRATLSAPETEARTEPAEVSVREAVQETVAEAEPRVEVVRTAPNVRTAPSSRWRTGLGAQVALQQGPAPGILWTLPPFVELRLDRPDAPDPVFRLSVGRGADEEDSADGATARFTWTFARAEACGAWDAGDFRFVPCVMAEGGALRGASRGVDRPRAESRPWFVLGLVGRGQWFLTPGFFLEAQGSLGTPVVRDRFYLEPDATVHDVPFLTWGGAVGLGAYFP
jgi:hypothetical protein